MEAGQLRWRIAIQVKTRAADGQGGYTESWATITGGNVWASIEPASSRELFMAQQLQHVVTHKVTIRYVAGVTTAHQIVFGSRVFNIQSVLNTDENNRTLVLLCEEGTAS